MTSTCIDCHVHLYSRYDPALAFRHLSRNLDALAPPGSTPAERVAVLTDGSSTDAFCRLRRGDSGTLPAGFSVSRTGDGDAIRISAAGMRDILLVAGRQVVTGERIELLSLASAPTDLDRLPAREVADRIRMAGGIPVASWAPGKWFGRRGRLVQELIDEASPGALLIGDTSLRCTGWTEPAAYRRAQDRGLSVVAGSDPLPLSGQERTMGSYGIVSDQPFDADHPAQALRRLLGQPAGTWRIAGRRVGPLTMLRRLVGLKVEKQIS